MHCFSFSRVFSETLHTLICNLQLHKKDLHSKMSVKNILDLHVNKFKDAK